ncbi:MAG: hypothetical protein A3F78_16575 [Burkholderiales bacterium RIFCSPLOWO2_12_FULL_61_40]|nr:MAG: hypothetical protein A3F78_16575 [Burkholderiales bacterium RIFCSPLOWO2_12_FULL_61_40]
MLVLLISVAWDGRAIIIAPLRRYFLAGLLVLSILYLVALFQGVSQWWAVFVDSQFWLYLLFACLAIRRTAATIKSEQFLSALLRVQKIALFVGVIATGLHTLSGNTIWMNELGRLRYTGTLGPSGTAIHAITMLLPFLAVGVLLKKGSYLWLASACIAIIALTGTRIVLLAMVAACLPIIASIPERRTRWLILVFVGALGLFALSLAVGRSFFEGVYEVGSFNDNGRFYIWGVFLDVAMQSPWLGLGAGSANEFLVDQDTSVAFSQIHNDYLRIFFISGAIGLAIFAWIGLSMYRASRMLERGSSSADRCLSVIARAYIVAFFIMMATDNVFIYHFYIYPLIIVFIYSVSRKPNNTRLSDRITASNLNSLLHRRAG